MPEVALWGMAAAVTLVMAQLVVESAVAETQATATAGAWRGEADLVLASVAASKETDPQVQAVVEVADAEAVREQLEVERKAPA